jgi:hypothetical protein
VRAHSHYNHAVSFPHPLNSSLGKRSSHDHDSAAKHGLSLRLARGGLVHGLVNAAGGCRCGRRKAGFIPADGLIAYLEFDGLDAHGEAWKATALHDIVVKTKTGAVMSELASRLSAPIARQQTGDIVDGAALATFYEHLLRHGFALAVHNVGRDESTATLVVNEVGSKEARQTLEPFYRLYRARAAFRWLIDKPSHSRIRGRDAYLLEGDDPAGNDPNGDRAASAPGQKPEETTIPPQGVAWREGNDLVAIMYLGGDPERSSDAQIAMSLETIHKKFTAQVADTIDGKLRVLELERSTKDLFDLDLQADVLKHFGPQWCIYETEQKKRERGERRRSEPGDFVLVAGLDDVESFVKTVDLVAAELNRAAETAIVITSRHGSSVIFWRSRDLARCELPSDPPGAPKPMKSRATSFRASSPARSISKGTG